MHAVSDNHWRRQAGKATDMSNSGSEAVQALLHSIAPELKTESMSPDTLQKLSGKITDLLGEDAAHQLLNGHSDQQVLNEEGLPILDVTENIASVIGSDRSPRTDDLGLVRFSSMTPEQNALRLRERDSILNRLEAEEEAERQRELAAAITRRDEAKRKLEESAINEKERFKTQRELQKKMGKALIRNITEARDREETAQRELQLSIQQKQDKDSNTKKKNVTFSEKVDVKVQTPFSATFSATSAEWGDVIPARLRALNSPTPKNNPVMSNVVERMPTGNPLKSNGAVKQFQYDSDDESDPPTSSSESENDPNREVEEELDLEYAQLQRDIALEYHKKRHQMGETATKAMLSPEPTAFDEADATAPRSKVPISRFKASRLAASYNVASSDSQSLDASLLPESGARALQQSIRVGNLDSDMHLVGNDGESDDETEAAHELLELLKKGQVENVGPNAPSVPSSPLPDLKPLERKGVPSKFKLSRSEAGPPSLRGASASASATAMPSEPPLSQNQNPAARPSMIVESPSFPYVPPSRHSSRPDKPPAVLTATVQETQKSVTGNTDKHTEVKQKKISRFMAERL